MKTAFFSFGFLIVLAYPLLIIGAIYLSMIALKRFRGCYGQPLNSPEDNPCAARSSFC